jgi:hypothetical protein
MSIAVWVEQTNGKYTASVPGEPAFRAVADSKDAAVAALKAQLESRVTAGDLVFVDVEPKGVLALTGKYKDDPEWQAVWKEIEEQAYRERDEEKAREFPG